MLVTCYVITVNGNTEDACMRPEAKRRTNVQYLPTVVAIVDTNRTALAKSHDEVFFFE